MKWGNCWIFAVKRLLGRGGYIILRPSKHHKFIIHAMWASSIEGIEVEEFVPAKPHRNWFALLHKVCFRGHINVKRSDL